ncbi:hypothetical protein BH23GEM10_BH23GEM10_09430 [soil metagenome]
MIMPGRNDPCPCGSGRKYKQCHGKAKVVSVKEATWQRLRSALDGYPDMMFRFIRQTYGEHSLDEAWQEFLLWPDEPAPFDDRSPMIPLFMPWFFHRWSPDPEGTSVADETLHEVPPTHALLQRRPSRLDPLLRQYLQACRESGFSFFEITRVQAGSGFHCRDLILEREHEVSERSASRTMQVGDAFFGQLVTCAGLTMMEAVGPYTVPPRHWVALLDLKEQMVGAGQPADDVLDDWDIELRQEYLDIVETLTAPLVVQNTDGEDILFHRLVYEVASAGQAFEALKDLGPELELSELSYDEHDELRAVSFSWLRPGNARHRDWQNTVLGQIEIDGRTLVVMVNSAERAARFGTIIEDRLGPAARQVEVEVTDPDEVAAGLDPEEEHGPADLSQSPELRQRVNEMMAAHYEQWLSDEIHALGGQTPLEAVRTPVGRRKVEALVNEIERNGRRMQPGIDDAIIARLRERLGLS